ncbi:MAG: WD40 repeat domain-containing protein, partial [Nibricoccus sp.]
IAKRHGSHRPFWCSPDGKTMLSLNETQRSSRNRDPIAANETALSALRGAVLPSKEGQSSSTPEVVEVLSVPDLTLNRTIELNAEGSGVAAIAASPDGSQVALSWRGKPDVVLISTESGAILRRLIPRAPQTYAIAYAPDGKHLVTGGHSVFLEIWNLQTDEPPVSIAAHRKSIRLIAFSPDGDTFATYSADQTHKFWSLSSHQEIARMDDASAVLSMQFSSDGKTFWAASASALKTWHVATRRELGSLPLNGRPTYFSLSPNQQFLGYCEENKDERSLVLLQIPSRAELDSVLTAEDEHAASQGIKLQVHNDLAAPAVEEGVEPSASDISNPWGSTTRTR